MQPSSLCKSCQRPIPFGDARCAEHEAQFQRWLQCETSEPDRPDVYQPRRDGISATALDRRTARRGLRRPRPGEELNFDAD